MFKSIFFAALLAASPSLAQQSSEGMTPQRLLQIASALDEDATISPGGITITINDVPVLIVMDPGMNRMRAMVPIRLVDGMTEDELARVMQANFDTALDARYAIARGQLWGVFIHPLRELQRDQLISGIGQTVNLALTYGTLYSGGAAQFGRGDSADLQQQLLQDLLDRGQDI